MTVIDCKLRMICKLLDYLSRSRSVRGQGIFKICLLDEKFYDSYCRHEKRGRYDNGRRVEK